MKILLVTAVPAEAEAVDKIDGPTVVVAGVGRTNAAAATTEAIIREGPFEAALSVGVAGSLPGSGLELGAAVLASSCVYAEEGMIGPHGFADIAAMGMRLGPFEGNVVPVDEALLERLAGGFVIGPVATVAACSGTDAAALETARRTGALAEAMEGAAVVHAALRLRTPAIELRVISNTTGDRDRQQWDLARGLGALGPAVERALARLD